MTRPTPLTDGNCCGIVTNAIGEKVEVVPATLARRLERERDTLRETLEQIVWIKDCGIDGVNESGQCANDATAERDAMYEIARIALSRIEAELAVKEDE